MLMESCEEHCLCNATSHPPIKTPIVAKSWFNMEYCCATRKVVSPLLGPTALANYTRRAISFEAFSQFLPDNLHVKLRAIPEFRPDKQRNTTSPALVRGAVKAWSQGKDNPRNHSQSYHIPQNHHGFSRIRMQWARKIY